MSDSLSDLQRKLSSAGELKSVVRTMKAIAAASITRYERAVEALALYDQTVQRGLYVALREQSGWPDQPARPRQAAILFGSDQGLVGQFNEDLQRHALAQLAAGVPADIWVVGERLRDRMEDEGIVLAGHFSVPGSIPAITGLVARLLAVIEPWQHAEPGATVTVFHHRPRTGELYAPHSTRLWPTDVAWRQRLLAQRWPGHRVPQVFGEPARVLGGLIREYLFVSLYRVCAESQASEHASRLAAMQRADRNIDELLHQFRQEWNRQRQAGIDEELFDVLAGFEAIHGSGTRGEVT